MLSGSIDVLRELVAFAGLRLAARSSPSARRLTPLSLTPRRRWRSPTRTTAIEEALVRTWRPHTSMSTAYPLDVLWSQPETMAEVLDEARDLSIAHCRKALSKL